MGKHFERAKIWRQQGRYELEERELRKEIAKNPNFANAYAMLALCLIERPQKYNSISKEEPLQLIKSALSLEATNDFCHYAVAIYWKHNINYNRARISINKAIELNPNSHYYFFALAEILQWQGKFIFSIVLVGTFYFAQFIEGYIMRLLLKPVLTPLQKSLSIDPNFLPALNMLVEILVETGQSKKAFQYSQASLRLDPNNTTSQDLHGQISIEIGRYEEAIAYFREALRLDPNSKQSKDNLLEAIRSQYWLYPWISFTSHKGKLLFCFVLALGIIGVPLVKTFVISSAYVQNIFEIYAFIGVTILVTGASAQWMFNYFLIKDNKARLLLTDRDAVIANGAIAITTSMLVSTCPVIFLPPSFRLMAMNTIGIICGTLMPVFTLSVVKKSCYWNLHIGYQICVGVLGVINLIFYYQFNGNAFLGYSFIYLSLGSILVGVLSCKN
jgi:type IV pilus assembly protein PilF